MHGGEPGARAGRSGSWATLRSTRTQDLIAEVPGAERLVEFEIDELIETRNASPLRWRFQEYSPYNPV